MTSSPVTISILIPAYREEDTILSVLHAVAAQRSDQWTLEVIVVDDGSPDRTSEIVRAHPDLHRKLITLPQNGGKGAAVKVGLAAASGDYVLIQDADLEYDPSDYPRLIHPILTRNADVVLGSRLSAPAVTRVHYFWNKVGNRLITLLFNILYNTTFTDIYCGYLLYRRALLHPDDLRTVGWEQHAEMLGILVARAQSLYEVPISYFGRTYAEGKKIRPAHIAPVIGEIFRSRFANALTKRAGT